MEMRLPFNDQPVTVRTEAISVRNHSTEICYICTSALAPGDIVYLMQDDEDLPWFVHGSCLRCGTRACG